MYLQGRKIWKVLFDTRGQVVNMYLNTIISSCSVYIVLNQILCIEVLQSIVLTHIRALYKVNTQ